jgi:hypothetical protein
VRIAIARGLAGLGMAAIIAVALPSYAQTPAPPEAPASAVVKPPALSAADLAFGRNIALIRGHLLTGDELVGQGNWRDAAPHFSFPREEVYGLIRVDLRTYKVPAFDGALKALVNVVKARNAKQFPKARQAVETLLAAADASLKARQQSWPRFTVAVAISVLNTAPDEYDDAVAKGRVARSIGYQTARGFVLQAERMIEGVAGEFAGDNAAAFADVRAGFAELKAGQPSVNAPKQPTIDNAAFQSAVGKIEAAAAKLAP